MLQTIVKPMSEKCIQKLKNISKLHALVDRDCTIASFSFTRFGTDAQIQHTNQSNSAHDEVKHYFSRRHGLYGFITELSVISCGSFIHLCFYGRSGVSDISILKKNLR